MDNKQKVLAFLQTQSHMTVSTVSATGMPESSWVGFGEMEDLTLVFGTNSASRKYANLQKNSRVAIVVGNDDTAVQYEGEVNLLEGGALESYKEVLYAKIPEAQAFEHKPGQVFFKVTPRWMRFIHFGPTPEEFELTV